MDYRETLKNAKTGLSDLTQYATEGIKTVCEKFGPRPCGEQSETDAQNFMLEGLKAFSDEAHSENFKVNPDAFMSFVPIAGASLLGATGCNLLGAYKCKKASLGSAALMGGALAGIVGEFLLYKKCLDPFPFGG